SSPPARPPASRRTTSTAARSSSPPARPARSRSTSERPPSRRRAGTRAGPIPAGASLMLDDAKASPAVSSHPFSAYCPSTTRYDGVNHGTPGAGEGCVYRLFRDSDRPAIDIAATGHDLTGFVNALNVIGQIPGGLGFQMPFFGSTV